MEDIELWYWLCNLEQIGNKKINELLAVLDTPREIFLSSRNILENIKILRKRDVETILSNKDITKIKKNYANLKSKDIYFVTRGDSRFPKKLLNIPDAPLGIYIKGELPKENIPSIAIVGARNCSCYGKEMAYYFAKALSNAGIQVISGLANGIDGYAHQGALSGNGHTYGVLGCGIDICYPANHIELYMQMQKRGGVISEYSIGMPPKPGNFPMRNRIISGLSDAVLVVEAKEKSGSLITVDMALEQGKDVFAIPGRIGELLSSGCNNLIKMGAGLVDSPEDILFSLLPKGSINSLEMKKNNYMLETKEEIVYASLCLVPKHIDQILYESKLPIVDLMTILLTLEMKNAIRQVTNNYYVVNIR